MGTANISITENAAKQDGQLVDEITYMASLASLRREIDPMLDTLRAITARTPSGQAFSPADRVALIELDNQLKHYLIYEDRLRSFTAESLERRLRHEREGKGAVKGIASLVLLSIVVGMVPLLVSSPTDVVEHIVLYSLPLVFLVLTAGTAWLYFSALTDLKPELRKTFTLICFGIFLLGTTFAFYAVARAIGFDKHPSMQYSGPAWIVTAGLGFIYAGLRAYARLLQIVRFATSLPLVLSVLGVSMLAVVAYPHSYKVAHEVYFDITLASLAGITVLSFFGAATAWSIYRSVTSAYRKSILCFLIYLAFSVINNFGAVSTLVLNGPLPQSGDTSPAIIALALAPLLLLIWSGGVFKKETSQ